MTKVSRITITYKLIGRVLKKIVSGVEKVTRYWQFHAHVNLEVKSKFYLRFFCYTKRSDVNIWWFLKHSFP